MNDVDEILTNEYNDNFFASADLYSKILKEKGILVFSEFITKKVLKEMVNEANSVKPNAFKSSSEYNVYVQPTDLTYPINSARNRIMKTTKKCIPNDLISDESFLMKIYNSSKIKKFFCY